MATASRSSSRDTGIGKAGVPGVGVIALTLLLGAIPLCLVYCLVAFWPQAGADGKITGTTAVLFGQTVALDADRSVLVLVIIAGATGASAAVLRSFFKYAGERRLVWSWVPSYLLTPIVGALLALFMYIVVRAGLLSASGSPVGNPFGFAAVATLVGLFSAQAAEKLKEVFETIFAEAKTGRDPIDSQTDVVITSFDPEEGHVGEVVVLVGRGLEAATSVTFGGGTSRDATWDADAKVLRTSVPRSAETGALSVTVDNVTGTSIDPFTVLDNVVGGDGAPPPGNDVLADTQTIATGPGATNGAAATNGAGATNGAAAADAAVGGGAAADPAGEGAAGEGAAGADEAGDAGGASATAAEAAAPDAAAAAAADAAAAEAAAAEAAAAEAGLGDAAGADAAALAQPVGTPVAGDAAANGVGAGGDDPAAEGLG